MGKEGIGDRLKRLRLAAELSQRQLAKISGVDREYICQIERGKTKTMTLRIAEALAKGLGKSPALFFEDKHDETAEESLTACGSPLLLQFLFILGKVFPFMPGKALRQSITFIGRGPKWPVGT